MGRGGTRGGGGGCSSMRGGRTGPGGCTRMQGGGGRQRKGAGGRARARLPSQPTEMVSRHMSPSAAAGLKLSTNRRMYSSRRPLSGRGGGKHERGGSAAGERRPRAAPRALPAPPPGHTQTHARTRSLFHQLVSPALDGHVVEAEEGVEDNAISLAQLLSRMCVVGGWVGGESGWVDGARRAATRARRVGLASAHTHTPARARQRTHTPACRPAPGLPGGAPGTRPRGCTPGPGSGRCRGRRTPQRSASG